jgi:hypothetical protein
VAIEGRQVPKAPAYSWNQVLAGVDGGPFGNRNPVPCPDYLVIGVEAAPIPRHPARVHPLGAAAAAINLLTRTINLLTRRRGPLRRPSLRAFARESRRGNLGRGDHETTLPPFSEPHRNDDATRPKALGLRGILPSARRRERRPKRGFMGTLARRTEGAISGGRTSTDGAQERSTR